MALPPSEYKRLVERAVDHIKELLKGEKRLLILITPGSSRGEVVKRLLERGGVEVLAYGGALGAVPIEGVQDALGRLKGKRLEEALEERRVVVFKSTVEALAFKEALHKELGEAGEKKA